MGLLDQMAGQLIGSLGSQKQDAVPQGALLEGLMSLIDRNGGVPALLQKLQESGLSDQVSSWISTGENQPVSGDQMKAALGEDQIQELANQSGIEPAHVSTGLAQLLPQIIDQLTPGGNVPQNELLAQGLNLLKSKLFG